jgi:hypothetical protein
VFAHFACQVAWNEPFRLRLATVEAASSVVPQAFVVEADAAKADLSVDRAGGARQTKCGHARNRPLSVQKVF